MFFNVYTRLQPTAILFIVGFFFYVFFVIIIFFCCTRFFAASVQIHVYLLLFKIQLLL